MNLLRRAASETVRTLGINVPTALLAIFCIGIKVTIVDTLSAPETGPVTGSVLWVVESIAWLAAVVVVFVLFLVWNLLKVARRERSVSAHLSMIAESVASMDDRMKSFLRNTLINPWYGVAKCYAFGSVVRQYPTRDVDIIIQFDSSQRGRVRTCRERLRNIERSFQEYHGLALHVQTFLFAENEALDRFLKNAGQHERLI